ncbi:hypothetical protein CCACVL1_17165 [Corchorus capsularis]|uniref:Uncharacterized protein n=1 Tax=Corchorus capsularis TaxID=210143 RepID=A0A1R3HTK2_COCAP|nr:hypothetical protein CCACVL1_17165 [Corchorus capsularis]
MKTDSSRSKALKIAVSLSGVESASLRGVEKNQIEIVGSGIDPVKLISLIRKGVGHAELVSHGEIEEKKQEKKLEVMPYEVAVGWPWPAPYAMYDYEIIKKNENPRLDEITPSKSEVLPVPLEIGEKQINQNTELVSSSALDGESGKKEEKKEVKHTVYDRPYNSPNFVSEEFLTENNVNPREDEIIPSRSEASLELGDTKVDQPGDTSPNSSSPCIFRTSLPELLGFKEPELVSFGPYHRNKNLPLDKYKYVVLEKFLSRTRNQDKDLYFYVQQMIKLERHARRCYSEDLSGLPSSEFVEMMLVDGCFIMEVLCHFGLNEESENGVFPIEPWQVPILVRDLLLLENQIPFIVLDKLFDLWQSDDQEGTATVSVSTMALKVFDLAFPPSMDLSCKLNPSEVVPKHLLDLLLETIRPSNSNPSNDSPSSLFLKTIQYTNSKAMILLNPVFLLLFPNHRKHQMRVDSKKEDGALLKSPVTSSKQKEYEASVQSKPSTSSNKAKTIKKVRLLESAWELQRSGIELRPRRDDRFTDIHFKDGVLEIPPITINDHFIAILVNCVAFEHRSTGCSKDLTAYVSFLSDLIRYPTDVECLYSDGILSRFSYDNERVASSFNHLQSMVSDLEILQDSYLYKTIMEIQGYYSTGGGITCPPALYSVSVCTTKSLVSTLRGYMDSAVAITIEEAPATPTMDPQGPDDNIVLQRVLANVESKLTQSKAQRHHHNYSICPFPDFLHGLDDGIQLVPKLASFGPHHRGKHHLLPFEEQKNHFLSVFIDRGRALGFYAQKLMGLREETKKCYSEKIVMPPNYGELVEMILLDGSFMVELFCEYEEGCVNWPWHVQTLIADLLNLENQIPFCILEELFNGSNFAQRRSSQTLPVLALKFLSKAFCSPSDMIINKLQIQQHPKHLLDLFRLSLLPSPMTDPNKLERTMTWFLQYKV